MCWAGVTLQKGKSTFWIVFQVISSPLCQTHIRMVEPKNSLLIFQHCLCHCLCIASRISKPYVCCLFGSAYNVIRSIWLLFFYIFFENGIIHKNVISLVFCDLCKTYKNWMKKNEVQGKIEKVGKKGKKRSDRVH